MNLQTEVYSWLGFWRDKIPSDAVSSLQDVLGPIQIPKPDGQIRLWIANTDAGLKRTYSVSSDLARAKIEKHGLIVLSIRPATESDNMENL